MEQSSSTPSNASRPQLQVTNITNSSVSMPMRNNFIPSLHSNYLTTDTFAAQHFFLNRLVNASASMRHDSNNHASSANDRSIRPQFRSKIVCNIICKHCTSLVCRRGMKAILLADMNVELFSTDAAPMGVELVFDDYRTRNCGCRIKDVACLGCGNVIGYHVTQPCEPCMEACNNGHFWMFHIDQVNFSDRVDVPGGHTMLWAQLPRADRDFDLNVEKICR